MSVIMTRKNIHDEHDPHANWALPTPPPPEPEWLNPRPLTQAELAQREREERRWERRYRRSMWWEDHQAEVWVLLVAAIVGFFVFWGMIEVGAV